MEPKSVNVTELKGESVRNLDGENLGSLEEVVMDIENGRVSHGVLASADSLGLDDKLFAVPWEMFTVDTENQEIILDVAVEILQDAPGFYKDNWPDIGDRAWMGDVFRYYGYDPDW